MSIMGTNLCTSVLSSFSKTYMMNLSGLLQIRVYILIGHIMFRFDIHPIILHWRLSRELFIHQDITISWISLVPGFLVRMTVMQRILIGQQSFYCLNHGTTFMKTWRMERSYEKKHSHEWKIQWWMRNKSEWTTFNTTIDWETLHGHLIIKAGRLAELFNEEDITLSSATTNEVWNRFWNVNKQNMMKFNKWETWIDNHSPHRLSNLQSNLDFPTANAHIGPLIVISAQTTDTNTFFTPSSSKQYVDMHLLNEDQLCAYEIIVWHIDWILAGGSLPPLQTLIHDEGGTGKSTLI